MDITPFDFSALEDLIKRMDLTNNNCSDYRNEFMRDRDRVLYSNAFRRLSGKTQIYLTSADDHRKTRLTHTLEVSQIARTISKALGLNADLAEAISLAHDLGHTPFGHAGEQMLHEIMVPKEKSHIPSSPMENCALCRLPVYKDSFGFKHNIQSVRLVSKLEDSYGQYGLNLCNYTLWGIENHSSCLYKSGKVDTDYQPSYNSQHAEYYQQKDNKDNVSWSFEAFVVRIADDIAQWHHDLEDAIRGKAMTMTDVFETVKDLLYPMMSVEDKTKYMSLAKTKDAGKETYSLLSHLAICTLVNLTINSSRINLKLLKSEYNLDSTTNRSDFFKEHKFNDKYIDDSIGFNQIEKPSKQISKMITNYPTQIGEKVHHSIDVQRMNQKGKYMIKKMFQAYFSHPQQLPDNTILHFLVDVGVYKDINEAKSKSIGASRVTFEDYLKATNVQYTIDKQILLMRRICDHIACMTDNYALKEYQSLYG